MLQVLQAGHSHAPFAQSQRCTAEQHRILYYALRTLAQPASGCTTQLICVWMHHSVDLRLDAPLKLICVTTALFAHLTGMRLRTAARLWVGVSCLNSFHALCAVVDLLGGISAERTGRSDANLGIHSSRVVQCTHLLPACWPWRCRWSCVPWVQPYHVQPVHNLPTSVGCRRAACVRLICARLIWC